MAAISRADAVWEGDLTSGRGRVKVASGTFSEFPVTWATRTDREHGTSPEELIAAAHAACYSMAFSNGLSKAGHHPERLNTTAEVEFVPGHGGGVEVRVALDGREVKARVPWRDVARWLAGKVDVSAVRGYNAQGPGGQV